MVDAYKCQNCGEIVERPQNCPSCGENAMRPTRVPESELDAGDEQTRASDGDATADDEPGNGVTEDGAEDRRETTDGGGLLAWLKSLF